MSWALDKDVRMTMLQNIFGAECIQAKASGSTVEQCDVAVLAGRLPASRRRCSLASSTTARGIGE